MWKTLVDFSAQISRFKHILPLSTAQINCSGTDLPLFRKPYVWRHQPVICRQLLRQPQRERNNGWANNKFEDQLLEKVAVQTITYLPPQAWSLSINGTDGTAIQFREQTKLYNLLPAISPHLSILAD
jgi:hypothetical protein